MLQSTQQRQQKQLLTTLSHICTTNAGIEQACFSSRHARDLDLSTPSCTQLLREGSAYGFGAVHYLRDVGDAAKIVAAMQAGACTCG
jgi:hypothetical protein